MHTTHIRGLMLVPSIFARITHPKKEFKKTNMTVLRFNYVDYKHTYKGLSDG